MSVKSVFISYRRSNVYTALAVYKSLREHGYDVFFDYESIDSGAFDQIILNQIAARAHFVLLLTPEALERCSDPDDWVRREIEHAIDLKRNIVPLLFDDFDFAKLPEQLTGKLALLPRYNGLEIPKSVIYFDTAMQHLRERFLSKSPEGVMHPTPSQDAGEVQRKIAEADSQPIPTEEQLNAEEYNRSGNRRDAQKDYDGAIMDYDEAIRLNPDEAVYYENRAATHNRRRDYDAAISDANEALRLNAKSAAAYNQRALARNNQGDLDGAIMDFTEAIRLKPETAAFYYNRAIAFGSQYEYQAAINDYETFLQRVGDKRDSGHGVIEWTIGVLKRKLQNGL